uniref:Ovule protein n=1 Tax=Parastrongyloides trichosuri TaxID=131310 RepID=A0A0N4ZCA7_PARTI
MAIQILHINKVESFSFPNPYFLFNGMYERNPIVDNSMKMKNTQEEGDRKKYYGKGYRTSYMHKRMTPCYYSPIQCLVKRNINNDFNT